MTSFLKPLKAGTGKGSGTVYERVGEDEKPFLADGLDYNPMLQQKDMALKRRVRILKFISRLISFLISVAVVGMMGNTAFSYYSTHGQTQGPDGTSPWPENTKVWPTLMMLGVALMSLVSNAAVLISYCCGQSAANKASNVSSFFSVADIVVHIICWGVSAGLFKQQNGLNGVNNDLWGWSCSPAADERQPLFEKVINYDFLCMTNGISWYIALANTGSLILSLILFILAIKRVKSKKKVKKAAAAGGVHIPIGSSGGPTTHYG